MAESQKSAKKSWKTRKRTENVARNQKMLFWSHRKLEKNLQKARKSMLFLWKAGNRPLIPSHHSRIFILFRNFLTRLIISISIISGLFVKEQFCGAATWTSRSQFKINFSNSENDVTYRKIMLGTMFLLDFMHFEACL